MKRFEKVSRRNLALRRSASLICVLALLATTLGFGPLAAVHGFDEPRQEAQQAATTNQGKPRSNPQALSQVGPVEQTKRKRNTVASWSCAI